MLYYKIISADTAEELEEKVEDARRDGYIPCPGFQIASSVSSFRMKPFNQAVKRQKGAKEL